MSDFPPKFKATRDLEKDNEKLQAKVWRLKEQKRRLERKVRRLKGRIASQSVDAVGGDKVDTRLLVSDPDMAAKERR